MFPALPSSTSSTSVTGPVYPLIVYYNILRYARASLTVSTSPIEPPELVKFMTAPPRALGFALPNPNKSAYDNLNARVDDWATKARQLLAHYRANLQTLDSLQSAYKQYTLDVEQKFDKGSPDQAAALIHGVVTDSAGPSGQGAKLASLLGYTVQGRDIQHDSTAPASCDLGASTADSTGTPIFVEIPDSCIQNILDSRQTLLNGIGAAVIDPSPRDRISGAQADYLRAKLLAPSLTAISPGGSDNIAYATKSAAAQQYVVLLVRLTDEQFELPTDAGKCARGVGGTKTTISFTALDRFGSGESATVHNSVVTVSCYPRLAASAGIGYTTLPKTTFSTTETSFLLNGNSGAPPAPAPTFQPIFQLSSSSQGSHVGGIALLHLCFCAHPGDGVNLHFSFGFIAPDGEPLGLFFGLSAGFSHQYYLTLGGHYGVDTKLIGSNKVGDLVPSGFTPSTTQQWILRPAAAFTIGL